MLYRIWDLDGTLYYRNSSYSQYKKTILQKYLATFSHQSMDTILRYWDEYREKLQEKDQRKPSPREIFCCFPMMNEKIVTEIRKGIDPHGFIRTNSDLISLLFFNQNILAIVLFSTLPRELVNRSLAVLKIPQNLFRAIIAREDVIWTKPDPQGWYLSANRLQVSKQDYAWIRMCGDKYPHDIEPALKLGMQGLLVKNGPDDLLLDLQQNLAI